MRAQEKTEEVQESPGTARRAQDSPRRGQETQKSRRRRQGAGLLPRRDRPITAEGTPYYSEGAALLQRRRA